MIAACVPWLVWCMCRTTLAELQTVGPPPFRLNELLTPRACQALLAYTLTLGEPLLVDALFVFPAACVIGHVCYRSLFIDVHWVCHGNSLSDRVSAGFTSALYSPD